jgi:hypothetical protein
MSSNRTSNQSSGPMVRVPKSTLTQSQKQMLRSMPRPSKNKSSNRQGRRSQARGSNSSHRYVQNFYQGEGEYDLNQLPGQLVSMLPGFGPFLKPVVDSFFGGDGDYKIEENSLVLNGNPPKVRNIQKGEATVIAHRERVGLVLSNSVSGASGSAFQNVAYAIQPGTGGSFTWLSGVAQNYQEYRFTGIIYHYKSLSSDAVVGSNNNAALGEIIMATNYNAGSPAFTNDEQMLQTEYSQSSKPSKDMYHMIECKRSLTPVSELFVRGGTVPNGQDPRLYDMGVFQIATLGCQALSAQLGELWVSYEIELYKPILGSATAGLDVPTDKFQLTGPLPAAPLGSAQKQTVSTNAIGGTCTSTTYTFPDFVNQGTYLFLFRSAGSAVAITLPTITPTAGSTTPLFWSTTSGNAMGSIGGAPATGVSSALASQAFFVNISSIAITPVVITWSTGASIPTGTTYGDLIVTQVNSSVSGLVGRIDRLLSIEEVDSCEDSRPFEYCPYTGQRLTQKC